jgi:hypothetical protein
MTAKLDGTNGLLQAYDYQTPTTGFSYTFAAGTQTLFMVPAATLATGTITMPASPADGMMITFSSSQQITALTLQGNTGQSISSAVTFLPAKTAAAYVYRLSNTTWYPTETVPGTGSQLVSGVSQASTSGTSIDFTGIPSWVKRITLMLSAVSTSGTSLLRIQIGGGSFTTSGYVGCTSAIVSGTAGSNSFAGSGWDFNDGAGSASASRTGVITIANLTGNTWVMQGMYSDPVSSSRSVFGSGSVPIAATLDRLRVTTVNGTDTFDAGSINILYE